MKIVALLAVFSLAGCVSASKYKKLETDSMSRINELTAKNVALEQDVAAQKMANENLQKTTEQVQSQYENIVGQLQSEVAEGQLKVTQYKNMLTVDVAEKLFFNSGSAKLKADGKTVLKKVGDLLGQYPDKIIQVVGHTDNVPLGKVGQQVFPSNWELSVIRATNVVRFLQDEAKIPAERLIAMGRGEFEPVAPNDTAEGRQKNRRIEIMLVDKSTLDAMKQLQQQQPQ